VCNKRVALIPHLVEALLKAVFPPHWEAPKKHAKIKKVVLTTQYLKNVKVSPLAVHHSLRVNVKIKKDVEY